MYICMYIYIYIILYICTQHIHVTTVKLPQKQFCIQSVIMNSCAYYSNYMYTKLLSCCNSGPSH